MNRSRVHTCGEIPANKCRFYANLIEKINSRLHRCMFFAEQGLVTLFTLLVAMMNTTGKFFLLSVGVLAFLVGALVSLRPDWLHASSAEAGKISTSDLTLSEGETHFTGVRPDVAFEPNVAARTAAVVQVIALNRKSLTLRAMELENFFSSKPNLRFEPTEEENEEVGSGFVVHPDGFVITDLGLLKHAFGIQILLNDGSRLPAVIKGTDSKNGLAVLKIEAANLPFIPVDQAPEIKPGQLVFAIGSPWSETLRNTITAGIVSAVPVNNHVSDAAYWVTDAALNPGNSGGPLVDAKGQLVGMTIDTQPAGSNNWGVQAVLSATQILSSYEAITERQGQAELGIQFGPASNERGAVVLSVLPGSSAQEAGLQQGDVIIDADNNPLHSFLDLVRQIEYKAPGDIIALQIRRGTDQLHMQIRLKPSGPAVSDLSLEQQAHSADETLELLLDDLSIPLIYDMGFPISDGALISYINPSSVMYQESALRSGMVIVELAGKPVKRAGDFWKIYDNLPDGQSYLIKIYRPNSSWATLTAIEKK